LEATYTMLIENRNQKESLRTAPGWTFWWADFCWSCQNWDV
jgi:hypothetical protein